MKNINIQLHFVQEVIKDGKIILQYTPTVGMPADFLTNSVPFPALTLSLLNLGIFFLEGRGGIEV